MNKRILLGMGIIPVMLLLTAGTAVAQPTIDGTISPGEWDAYYLGTSETTWQEGMAVDVYGYADATYLYVAYVADTSKPGWAVASGLCVNANLYYSIVYDTGFKDTLFQMWEDPCQVMQTEDWNSWDGVGTLNDAGVVYYYIDMYVTPTGVAEFKIPLSLLDTEGASQIELYGQYWQYDWATPFYVELPPPTRVDVLSGNDVPGKGIEDALGLQKPVPNSNFANGTGK